jgi:tetratricopeptide (TPR) repeat protein
MIGRFTALAALAVFLLAAPALARPADLDGWYQLRSPRFVVYTDADPERGAEIVRSLERFRAVFARLAPEIELRSPAPTKILAFRDARSYAPYKTVADGGGARVLGQFLSHPDGNYLTLDAGAREVGAYAVIYHEYVHYFVRHNFPGVPRWFNEGLAEYYSTFATDGERAYLGRPVERHRRWLRHHGDLSVSAVLGTEAPERHGGQAVGRFYAVSWALVHYLLSGEPERLEGAADLFLHPERREDPEAAFEAAFGVDTDEVEAALAAYLRRDRLPEAAIPLEELGRPFDVRARPMAPADVLYHLGDLLAHMGRAAEAEEHFQLALDHRGDHPEVHAGLAFVRDLQNRLDEAEVLYRDALDLGSLDPLTYLLYGRHLLARLAGLPAPERAAVAARARAVLAHAVELDDDYAEAHVLFAVAHLTGDVDAAPGLRSVAEARRLLPGRVELIALEATLHARGGDAERAEYLVENVLAERADPAKVDHTRREVARLLRLRAAKEALDREAWEEAVRLYDEAVSLTDDPRLRDEMEEQLLELQRRLEM